MADETRHHRQLDLAPPSALQVPITIIGAGAIGSFSALALAKMGCGNIAVYDFDTVENHNLPNQFYRVKDVGKLKVIALNEIVAEFTEVGILPISERFTNQPFAQSGQEIVISAVDSMDTRMAIWERVKYNAAVTRYIEGRMGAEVLRLYSVNPCDPDDVRLYEGNLYPSSEALPVRCTAKSIMYTVLAVSSLIAGQVKKACMGEAMRVEIVYDMKQVVLL